MGSGGNIQRLGAQPELSCASSFAYSNKRPSLASEASVVVHSQHDSLLAGSGSTGLLLNSVYGAAGSTSPRRIIHEPPLIYQRGDSFRNNKVSSISALNKERKQQHNKGKKNLIVNYDRDKSKSCQVFEECLERSDVDDVDSYGVDNNNNKNNHNNSSDEAICLDVTSKSDFEAFSSSNFRKYKSSSSYQIPVNLRDSDSISNFFEDHHRFGRRMIERDFIADGSGSASSGGGGAGAAAAGGSGRAYSAQTSSSTFPTNSSSTRDSGQDLLSGDQISSLENIASRQSIGCPCSEFPDTQSVLDRFRENSIRLLGQGAFGPPVDSGIDCNSLDRNNNNNRVLRSFSKSPTVGNFSSPCDDFKQLIHRRLQHNNNNNSSSNNKNQNDYSPP